ncbi:hypothetical protein DTO166G4_2088 [Paecilomyces variotii]|nr:hypothetical protein DTO166G4_2088 [Paecilomyces variotii]KAJ9226672.1 hypothetical protein DTO169C6_912 [Paecilomyces variotii]KAJ9252654.1 hypothetical protein DTO207G8_4716 [Paecilomyces variotii]KAJ9287514.1 hypothetical protein DTO021C3_4807 [Paecilomyces variotii]KAJ9362610.1 hypothetical protein DTO027B9_287 [Paecilomyces variotii]
MGYDQEKYWIIQPSLAQFALTAKIRIIKPLQNELPFFALPSEYLVTRLVDMEKPRLAKARGLRGYLLHIYYA